jgi:uncharacterized protein YndB with AHSA1/START domain
MVMPSDLEKVHVEHVYEHGPAAVWKALTDSELVARWWAPNDLRAVVGHKFHFDMGKWGQQPCEVIALEPERLLAYRFGIGSIDTIVTWRLVPEGEGTRLHLTHEGTELSSPLAKSALEGMKPGWPKLLERMESVL